MRHEYRRGLRRKGVAKKERKALAKSLAAKKKRANNNEKRKTAYQWRSEENDVWPMSVISGGCRQRIQPSMKACSAVENSLKAEGIGGSGSA